jgi:hypothetical protein
MLRAEVQMVKGKAASDKTGKATRPKDGRDSFGLKEVPVGASLGVYSTVNPQGQQIGWYVVVGTRDVTAGGYTWLANRAYWFWWAAPFPDAFGLTSSGSTPPTGLNPAVAVPVTTAGPFDTSKKVQPASLVRWWRLSLAGSVVGAVGTSNGATQYWYQLAPNPYLPVGQGQTLAFSSTDQPTTPMYQAIDSVV